MPRRSLLLPIAAAAGAALFVYGMIEILLLRYERGDLYPAYSTLRTDPLGARAFYEALGATGKYWMSRGLVSTHRELAARPRTLFFLGLTPFDIRSFSPEEISELSDYVKSGGRVVIAFQAVKSGDEDSFATAKKKDAKDEKGKKKEPKKSEESIPNASPEKPIVAKTQQERFEHEEYNKEKEEEKKLSQNQELFSEFKPSLAAVWGFGQELHPSANDGKREPGQSRLDSARQFSSKGDLLAVRAEPGELEKEVPWKSAEYFVRLEPGWQVIYKAMGRPVLVERDWGEGQILLATDSYFLSNEAMRDDRRPVLLNHLAGPPGRLLFDEVHLGTEENEGVMVLAQRFRLEGYLIGMLLVAGLFLWRNSVPLVPARPGAGHAVLGGVVSGKDSRAGLINLLRRNISPRDLLSTCMTEWKKQVRSDPTSSAKAAGMESIVSSTDVTRSDGIVQAYQQLREINTDSRMKESYATKS